MPFIIRIFLADSQENILVFIFATHVDNWIPATGINIISAFLNGPPPSVVLCGKPVSYRFLLNVTFAIEFIILSVILVDTFIRK